MPSALIEQIRQQFYASLGINENTPISDADAPVLIDRWEQYLYSAAAQSSVGSSPYPVNTGGYPGGYGSYPGFPSGPPRYVPPVIRGAPGYQGPQNVPPGTPSVYVSPPGGGNTGIAPPGIGTTRSGLTTQPGVRMAPPLRR